MEDDIDELLKSHRLHPNDEMLLSKIALHYIAHLMVKKIWIILIKHIKPRQWHLPSIIILTTWLANMASKKKP